MPATPALIPRTRPLLGPTGVGTTNQVLSSDGAGGTYWVTAGSGGVTDHGALTGLADDDHAQYVAINGREGGQTIVGGASGNLVLHARSGFGGNVLIGHAASNYYSIDVSYQSVKINNNIYGTNILFDLSVTHTPKINMTSFGAVGWAPGSSVNAFNADTTVSRDSAGVVKSNKAFLASECRLSPMTDATRPAAGIAGRVIYNSDDGTLNIDTGTQWVTPDGVIT